MDSSQQPLSAPSAHEHFAPPTDEASAKRSSLTAAILSFLWPGVGQLYAGRIGRGVAILVAYFLMSMVSAFSAVAWKFGFLLALFVELACRAGAAMDAWRQAPKLRDAALPPYFRWPIYVVVILGLFAFQRGGAEFLRRTGPEAFVIPGNAMRPTIFAGDRIVVDNSVFGARNLFGEGKLTQGRPPRRGEIVTFRWQGERTVNIGRVIALPGETIEVRENQAYIDDRPLEEPYANLAFHDEIYFPYRDFGPREIPSGFLFVLMDNRDSCRDSREWGAVPLENLIGKALYIYYSVDPIEHEMRWDRIGTEFTDPIYDAEREMNPILD